MTIFNQPVHRWTAKMFGVHVSPATRLVAGKEIHIQCNTMCGGEIADGDYIIQQDMSVEEAVRRAQFAASIQHVTRRGCIKCKDQYQHGTTSSERDYLNSTHPELGPIVGLDQRGEYGAPLGDVVPEDIGTTDQTALDVFNKEQSDNNSMMQEKIKEIQNNSGQV